MVLTHRSYLGLSVIKGHKFKFCLQNFYLDLDPDHQTGGCQSFVSVLFARQRESSYCLNLFIILSDHVREYAGMGVF